jgi:hypothetical protein
VLRRDTLRIIDGAGPSIDAPQATPEKGENEGKTERETVPVNHESYATETKVSAGEQVQTKPERETGEENVRAETSETKISAGSLVQTVNMPKCTFPGLVSIDLKRFQDSDTQLVECPDCGRTRTLSLVKGVLRFKAHTRRKQQTPLTEKRWSATGKTDWDVVGG